MFALVKTTAVLALSLAPFALIFPALKKGTQDTSELAALDGSSLPGHWNFSLMTTEGAKAGGLLNGKLLLGANMPNRLVVADQPTLAVTSSAYADTVQLNFPEMALTAVGKFNGSDIIFGNFSTQTGARGVWVAARDGQANTKIKGRYNFEVTFPSKARPPFPLGGTIEFSQETTYIHGLTRVSPQVTGKLQAKGRALNLEGIASGGQVFFNLGNQFLAFNTTLAETSLSGDLVSADGKLSGQWKASLIAEAPNLARNWVLLAKPTGAGSELYGRLNLSQTSEGRLSGAFIQSNGHKLGVGGSVDKQGVVQLTLGDYDLSGQFDFLAEEFVTGTLVNRVTGKVGSWGIRIR